MDQIVYYILAYYIMAKAFLAATPTPNTETWYGKVYRAIEWSVLVIGRVKEDAAKELPPKV